MKNTKEFLKVGDKILFNDGDYNRMLGSNGLTGIITKIVHKNTGVTYNVTCESNGDSICCVPCTCVSKV